MRYLKPGEYGVLDFYTSQGEGILVFRVVRTYTEKPATFEYGSLVSRNVISSAISPDTVTDSVNLGITIGGRTIIDVFAFYNKPNYLLHVELKMYPPVKVYKYFTLGHLQGSYEPILTADETTPFGFEWPPIEFISVPNVTLGFRFRNPYETESVDPYVEWDYMWYIVKYPKDADLYEAVLKGKVKVPWFQIYGPMPFDYNFQLYIKSVTRSPCRWTPPGRRSSR